MKRFIPASRAVVLALGLVMATTTFASAAEEAAAKPFSPTIYGGASIGYADQEVSKFGWSVGVLARFHQYAGVQVEYLNLGGKDKASGFYDLVYFGVMPLLPIGHGIDLFAQLGFAVGDPGDDVAVGGGMMYELPLEILAKNNVDLNLRLDYKYLNVDDGAHLLTLGFMLGFHK